MSVWNTISVLRVLGIVLVLNTYILWRLYPGEIWFSGFSECVTGDYSSVRRQLPPASDRSRGRAKHSDQQTARALKPQALEPQSDTPHTQPALEFLQFRSQSPAIASDHGRHAGRRDPGRGFRGGGCHGRRWRPAAPARKPVHALRPKRTHFPRSPTIVPFLPSPDLIFLPTRFPT